MPTPLPIISRRHSWFKHKVLSYSVTLHVPSLLATEKAKCGRAVNALRACVRSRDEAHARGGEAVLERKEATSNVEVCVPLYINSLWPWPMRCHVRMWDGSGVVFCSCFNSGKKCVLRRWFVVSEPSVRATTAFTAPQDLDRTTMSTTVLRTAFGYPRSAVRVRVRARVTFSPFALSFFVETNQYHVQPLRANQYDYLYRIETGA